MPQTSFPEEEWKDAVDAMAAVDRKERFATIGYFGGVFERLHYLQGMEQAMINLYEEPEASHELIDFITEYELSWAREMLDHLHPDAIFHHDDWGTGNSTFLSPEMFREFIKPAYAKIYKFYRDKGVQLIIHHSDSWAASLVPDMVDLGIDIWQGTMSTNNIPELIKNYGGKISFMGGLDSGRLDKADWSKEEIKKDVEAACRANGKLYYIPCLIQGGPFSTFPGVYEAATEAIDEMSKVMFQY
jgi:uroporphyrinogen-III decarboxylase